MKNQRTLLKAAVAALLACTAGFAAAADIQTVAVNASVSGVCKFSGAAAAINFGAIDPSAAAAIKNAAITVPYKCTKGLTPAVTTGTIVPLTSGTDTMVFTVDSFVTVAGAGFTAAVNATSAAHIAAAVWQDAPAGTYVGSVVLNINN
ncbi:MAG: hypothetical protein JWR68_3339 [Polaromonas sp.]|nr:hypothetical protein [Polaromonas sp.]